jgi:hypothetical protein
MENRYSSVGIGNSEIGYVDVYPNRWAFSIKIKDSETGDILRDCRKIHFDKPDHLSIFTVSKILAF